MKIGGECFDLHRIQIEKHRNAAGARDRFSVLASKHACGAGDNDDLVVQ